MDLTIDQALQRGIEAHKAGQLQEAERLYRLILQKVPKHPDANHNLGVLAISVNRAEVALPLFKVALEANPKQGQFWISYIETLIKEKQFDNAKTVLEQGKKLGLAGARVDELEAELIVFDVNSNYKIPEMTSLSTGVELREAGRYKEAEDLLKILLSSESSNAEAWSLLSQIYILRKKDVEAEQALSRALAINSELPSIYRNQARLLLKKINPEEALVKAQFAYERFPEDPENLVVMAACLGAIQKNQDAYILIEKALRVRPNYAEAFANRSLIRLRANDIDGATKDAEMTVFLKPHLTQFWAMLGSLRYLSKNLLGAIDALTKAHDLDPSNGSYMVDLGEFFRQVGEVAKAIAILEKATKLAHDNAAGWVNLGTAYQEASRNDDAKLAYENALAISPKSAEISNNLGMIAKDHESARRYFEQAIAIKPDSAETHSNLGVTLKELHRYADAMASTNRALALNPKSASALQAYSVLLAYTSDYKDVCKFSDDALLCAEAQGLAKTALFKIWESRLYTWIYHPDLTSEEICAEHIKWGSGYKHFGREGFAEHDRLPGRRLRIGYVSPDFRGHTCRFYFEPLFSSHDHTRFEVFAYSNVVCEDEHTERMKPYFDRWRNILGLSDEAAAQLIRKDKIDILIDGCGHMTGTRLKVFAHKPAPIQVTWLGSAWTTGLPQMDYVLFDPYMAPEGTASSEKIVHLPRTWAAFRPGERAMRCEVKPSPAVDNGYVTFGYTGRTERLNHRVFHGWGRILKRLPQARLVLDFKPFNDPKTQAYYREFLEEHGVDTTRVVMRNSENIFEGLGDIDILLDSFPHSGGTMLFDALWMGVPAVTLASSRPVGRIGTSLMINLGLPEWVAQSEQEYEDKAVAFAQDMAGLASLRGTMRARMQGSPVMDERSFGRDVEGAYEEMWRTWLSENSK